MLAVRLDGTVTLDRSSPEPRRAPGEAVVRLGCAGLCDTDLQLARGYMAFSGILGHEFVGEVVEAESESWLGCRVVADINAGCGACPDCRLPSPLAGHHCATRTVLGIAGRDGVFAERFSVPERCLVALPEGIPDELAVFAEPVAAALHTVDALRHAEEGPNERLRESQQVIVIGDGKLGLLIALALRAEGYQPLVVGHHASKLQIAADAGCGTLLEGDIGSAGLQAAAVVEASGSTGGLALALRLAAPRGRVVLKTTVSGHHSLDLSPIVIRELSVVGSRCGDIRAAVAAIHGGRIDPRRLIEATYPLVDAETAFEHAARRGALKILITGSRGA